jgi:tyrosyl-tRNA synthetase
MPMMNFVEELRWRGMIHDIMPGTEEFLVNGKTSAYVGFDPTADSLHIGHLVGVMMLKHFQNAGHRPIVLIGGATGMIGDPSGKSEERNLLSEETLRHNQNCLKKQFEKFLDFNSTAPNKAVMVNNYDWMKTYSFLEFIRDIGKHITVNYMMAKDSVKKRLDSDTGQGMSFTEFSYQLVQGTDYLFLYTNHGCRLQMGGSDQWGNIVTGTELIRRKAGGEAYAITSPLITKSDGQKFGKTESGNVWLDPAKTTPYQFYQFWMNVTDDDAFKFIRIFTMLSQSEIDDLVVAHRAEPHMRILQKRLAEEVTVMAHSRADYDSAVEASQILFGKGTTEQLRRMDESTFLAVFEGVPMYDVNYEQLDAGVTISDLCVVHTSIAESKGELRRLIQGGGVSLNKERIDNADMPVTTGQLLNLRYLLLQKGKKNYFLIRVVKP